MRFKPLKLKVITDICFLAGNVISRVLGALDLTFGLSFCQTVA